MEHTKRAVQKQKAPTALILVLLVLAAWQHYSDRTSQEDRKDATHYAR